jgi:methylated-DNA-[protein]-cysteine S-methyltransferase
MEVPIMILEEIDSPIGRVMIVSNGRALCAVEFEGSGERVYRLLDADFHPGKSGFSSPLRDYFAGDLAAVENLEVEARGTEFQKTVWSALRTIPAGHVMTYGGLAEKIGRPKASRAVGLANSQNPVAIVQPCHRVIGANSKLTGYAGGLERKHWLLCHEGYLLA